MKKVDYAIYWPNKKNKMQNKYLHMHKMESTQLTEHVSIEGLSSGNVPK